MPCRTHYIVSCLLDEMDDERFTDWEREFVESVATQIERQEDATLSEKQNDVLDKLWRKSSG